MHAHVNDVDNRVCGMLCIDSVDQSDQTTLHVPVKTCIIYLLDCMCARFLDLLFCGHISDFQLSVPF